MPTAFGTSHSARQGPRIGRVTKFTSYAERFFAQVTEVTDVDLADLFVTGVLDVPGQTANDDVTEFSPRNNWVLIRKAYIQLRLSNYARNVQLYPNGTLSNPQSGLVIQVEPSDNARALMSLANSGSITVRPDNWGLFTGNNIERIQFSQFNRTLTNLPSANNGDYNVFKRGRADINLVPLNNVEDPILSNPYILAQDLDIGPYHIQDGVLSRSIDTNVVVSPDELVIFGYSAISIYGDWSLPYAANALTYALMRLEMLSADTLEDLIPFIT